MAKSKEPRTAYLAPDVILSISLGREKNLGKFWKNKKITLCTSGFSIWEALTCMTVDEMKDNAENIHKMVNGIHLVDMMIGGQEPMKQNKARIKHLRKVAFDEKE